MEANANEEVKPSTGNESSSSEGEKCSTTGQTGVSAAVESILQEKQPAQLSFDDIVEELHRQGKTGKKYTDGWDPDKLEEELKQHPFFMTEMPKEGEPVPPLIEAFQQLKYSPDENTPNELAQNHKEDGLFHFKLKKYRIAVSCFTEGIRSGEKEEKESRDNLLLAQLYNNRSAAQMHLKNYRSALEDCKKALEYKDDYLKPARRAIDCCMKLERWAEVVQYCDLVTRLDMDNEEIPKIRLIALKNKNEKGWKDRKKTKDEKDQEEKFAKIISIIKERGIKMTNPDFLQDDEVIDAGKIVNIAEDGKLEWPVLFFYPQFSESDFIEAFHEDAKFEDHLAEMLENSRPAWDKDDEYHLDSVDLYFIDMKKSGYVKIDIKDSLATVLSSERFHLPTNGIPSFFVMSRKNAMCNYLVRQGE